MKRLLLLIQFFPLTVFLIVPRLFPGEGSWARAFQSAAIVALVQLALLWKQPISRLVGGVNLFLVVGGIAFFTRFDPLLEVMDSLRETSLIVSVVLVCAIATAVSPSGIFESQISSAPLQRKYSLYFLAAGVVAVFVSAYSRGDLLMAGVVPFTSLIFLKEFLQKRLTQN